jgi:hypothetical protein
MRPTFTVVPLAALVACTPDELPSEYADSTLDQATVVPLEPLEGTRRDSAGTMAGDGEGPDLDLQAGSSLTKVAVHAPAAPDLSAWIGSTVRMSIVEVAAAGDASLLILDESDAVVYLLETVEPDTLTAEAFGGNFISLGDDLGPTPAHRGTMRIYGAFVSTDAGEVELFPGEPQEILVGGASYRATLTAAWHRELDKDAVLNCTIRADVLAYEVVRVDPGTADLTPLLRDPLLPIEQGTCGLPLVGGTTGS